MAENVTITHDDQDWVEAYKELCVILAAIDGINWADLWNEQPYFVSEEYPCPVPSVYLEFTANSMSEKGDQGQVCDYNITVYLYYADITDSYHGSWNQADALKFGALSKAIHRALQGKKGTNFSRLTRVDQKRMEAPHAGGRLMYQVYNCIIVDNSAVVSYETDLGETRELIIGKGPIPGSVENPDPLYGDLGF